MVKLSISMIYMFNTLYNISVLNKIEFFDYNFWVQTVSYNINSFHFELIKPEIFLLVFLIILLLLSSYLRHFYRVSDISGFIYLLVLCLILFVFIFSFRNFSDQFCVNIIFNSAIVIDYYTIIVKIAILGLSILVLIAAYNSMVKLEVDGVEFPILIGLCIWFLLILVSSFNMLTLYLSIEGLSFLLYILTVYPFTSNSLEAAIKYFTLGAISSGILLLGITLLYGLTGSLDFMWIKYRIENQFEFDNILWLQLAVAAINFSFFFKLAIFPCHMWSVDVYEGTWLPVTVFFMVVVKLGVFFIFLRLLFYLFFSIYQFWQTMLLVASMGSLFVGSIGALSQLKLKKLFVYSSVSQMGFVFLGLIPCSISGLVHSIFFFMVYLMTSLGIFFILLNTENFITGKRLNSILDLTNFSRNNFFISICFAICLLSLAGIPPLTGFYCKYLILRTLVEHQYHFLTIFAILMSVLNSFAYIRLIKIMFFDNWKIQTAQLDTYIIHNLNSEALKIIIGSNRLKVRVFFEFLTQIIVFNICFFLVFLPIELNRILFLGQELVFKLMFLSTYY